MEEVHRALPRTPVVSGKQKAKPKPRTESKKKTTSHANRGLKFEALFQVKCDELKEKGIALINKVPTEFKVIRNGARIVSAFPVEESKFVDFIGIHNGVAVAIELKETKEAKRFPFQNIKQTQIDFLNKWWELGGKGYYLIRFETNKKVFLIDSNKMHECMENIGRKSISYNDCISLDEFIEIDYKELNFTDFI